MLINGKGGPKDFRLGAGLIADSKDQGNNEATVWCDKVGSYCGDGSEEKDDSASEDDAIDCSNMRVVELKKILRHRGLETNGSKRELIIRLNNNDDECPETYLDFDLRRFIKCLRRSPLQMHGDGVYKSAIAYRKEMMFNKWMDSLRPCF